MSWSSYEIYRFLVVLLIVFLLGYYLVEVVDFNRNRSGSPVANVVEEGFSTTEKYGIIYCSKEETANIICCEEEESAENDHYFTTFGPTDFRVRKCPPSIDAYKARIRDQTCDLVNHEDQKKLDECITEADLFFLSTKFRQSPKCSVENGGWIDAEKMTHLPWKIGFIGPPDTDGFHYEGGLPHTRGKTTIIMPLKLVKILDRRRLTALLIHEKCHVYQKMYPESCELYIADRLHYSRVRLRHPTKDQNIRANPDTDGYIYKDNSTGKLIAAYYEDDPQYITDILSPAAEDQRFEHPYEEMAIDVEELSGLQSELWIGAAAA